MLEPDLKAALADEILPSLGRSGRFEAAPLAGGTNNRAFRLDTPEGPLFLKVYFGRDGSHRDRLETEFRFARFAWRHGVRRIPEPLAAAPEHHVGLFELIEGRRPDPSAIDRALVDQAAAFHCEVNAGRDDPAAADLPTASDSCFSTADHLRCLSRRIERLSAIEDRSEEHRVARALVVERLVPLCRAASESYRTTAERLGMDFDARLPRAERCLSASDFGFHNALLAPDGRVRFHDFEYAGWDDPAKTVADFFGQPEAPVPMALFDGFSAAVLAGLPNAPRHEARARALVPLHRLKWCCILLNDFLPGAEERRKFAVPAADSHARWCSQLDKARRIVESMAD